MRAKNHLTEGGMTVESRKVEESMFQKKKEKKKKKKKKRKKEKRKKKRGNKTICTSNRYYTSLETEAERRSEAGGKRKERTQGMKNCGPRATSSRN